jgi:hypothetical protein
MRTSDGHEDGGGQSGHHNVKVELHLVSIHFVLGEGTADGYQALATSCHYISRLFEI